MKIHTAKNLSHFGIFMKICSLTQAYLTDSGVAFFFSSENRFQALPPILPLYQKCITGCCCTFWKFWKGISRQGLAESPFYLHMCTICRPLLKQAAVNYECPVILAKPHQSLCVSTNLLLEPGPDHSNVACSGPARVHFVL